MNEPKSLRSVHAKQILFPSSSAVALLLSVQYCCLGENRLVAGTFAQIKRFRHKTGDIQENSDPRRKPGACKMGFSWEKWGGCIEWFMYGISPCNPCGLTAQQG